MQKIKLAKKWNDRGCVCLNSTRQVALSKGCENAREGFSFAIEVQRKNFSKNLRRRKKAARASSDIFARDNCFSLEMWRERRWWSLGGSPSGHPITPPRRSRAGWSDGTSL